MVKQILIVDDEEDIREVLSALLKIHGFDTLLAQSGSEGIAIFRENKANLSLVILDIMLPDIDGLQILQVIRKESKIPIVMLTARDTRADKILGLELGADDYVVKPFDSLELLARIKAVLRRYQERSDTYESLSMDFEINEEKRTVVINEKKVQFTYTEFELFKYLLSRKNEVVTRKDIKDTIWGDKELYQWSRTIDVHISHIREKIEEDPENPKILITVPQKGYKLKI